MRRVIQPWLYPLLFLTGLAAALELARQTDSAPDYIYVSGGTMGTVIGLALGFPALRVQHHYLAFATLGFNVLMYLVFRNEDGTTARRRALHDGQSRRRRFGQQWRHHRTANAGKLP